MANYCGGETFKFIWEIENYNYFHPQRGKCLKSPEFFVNVLGPIYLELYPKGDLFDEEEYVILCLNAACKLQEFSVDCDLKLRTKLGESIFAKEENSQVPRWKFKKITFHAMKDENKESILSAKATLCIKCEFCQNSISPNRDHDAEDKEDLVHLSDSMEKMCCNPDFSDFTLTVKHTKFQLHKAILHARAPKLAEKLKIGECSEATIEDTIFSSISTSIFKSFLVYIYSGKLPTLSTDTVSEFHYLAEMFEMTSLKRKLRCYPNETIARTVIKVDRKSFTWSIKDFDKLQLNKKFFGPAFSSGNLPKSDLQFVGCIEEDAEGNHDVKISICRLSADKNEPIFVKCKVVVINFTGEEKYQCVGKHYFDKSMEWVLPSFIKMKKIDDRGMYILNSGHVLCLRGKSFLLNVEFFISGKELTSQIEDTGSFLTALTLYTHSSDDVKSLSVDLGKLYNIFLPKMSDVILRVGDVRFPAHLVILCARSAVFSRMFEHEMLERKSETVEITDIDVATLNLMLMYMYSGKVDMVLSYDNALKLYAAADKYDIAPLRRKCTTILKSNLTHENVCSLFVLADMHSDIRLKNYAKDFICAKSNVILLLPEWKDLLNSRPDLATDVIQSLMSIVLLHKEGCKQCSKILDKDVKSK